jgi:hypothetical protein
VELLETTDSARLRVAPVLEYVVRRFSSLLELSLLPVNLLHMMISGIARDARDGVPEGWVRNYGRREKKTVKRGC